MNFNNFKYGCGKCRAPGASVGYQKFVKNSILSALVLLLSVLSVLILLIPWPFRPGSSDSRFSPSWIFWFPVLSVLILLIPGSLRPDSPVPSLLRPGPLLPDSPDSRSSPSWFAWFPLLSVLILLLLVLSVRIPGPLRPGSPALGPLRPDSCLPLWIQRA